MTAPEETNGREPVSVPSTHGDFLVRHRGDDDPPYHVDEAVYRRFDQRNDVFSREIWDAAVRDAEAPLRRAARQRGPCEEDGFTRLDFAFHAASWTVATALGSAGGAGGGRHRGLYSLSPLGGFLNRYGLTDMPPWDFGGYSPPEVSNIVKMAARFYGASLAGIAELDERWFYLRSYTRAGGAPIVFDDAPAPAYLEDGTLVVPRAMKYVIALAFEMDADCIRTSIAGPQGAASGDGYSRMTFTSATLAEFLRGLGYAAMPCGNNTALSIPIAIDAGLGELGRNGLLITPKYGPRVRLAKVFTDMPLAADRPISFGVTEFCTVCGRCARHCPGGAVATGQRTRDALDISTNPGVLKWPVHAPKCHQVWARHGQDCATCIRVCPFNNPPPWLHKALRILTGVEAGTLGSVIPPPDNDDADERLSPRELWQRAAAGP